MRSRVIALVGPLLLISLSVLTLFLGLYTHFPSLGKLQLGPKLEIDSGLETSDETVEDSFVPVRWSTVDATSLSSEELRSFNLVVTDYRVDSSIDLFNNDSRLLIAKLPLVEFDRESIFHRLHSEAGIPLKRLSKFKQVSSINSRYLQFLVEDLIPKILFKGFEGLQLEVPKGLSVTETSRLLEVIRESYPEQFLILKSESPLSDQVLSSYQGIVKKGWFSEFQKEKKSNETEAKGRESDNKSSSDIAKTIEEELKSIRRLNSDIRILVPVKISGNAKGKLAEAEKFYQGYEVSPSFIVEEGVDETS